ncbi:MAG: ABC transporter ATP-binding protein, partial [Pseudomonadota bacterium]
LKIILGLINANGGTVSVFGCSHKLPVSRKKLSYLPEKFQPPQVLTGHEFLRFACNQFNVPYNQQQAENCAKDLDLNPNALNGKIATYSKGMGQKIGLISQLLRSPPLLILDEPMSGLDPKARVVFKEVLKSYKKQGTVLFSSHILADIEEISDEMAVLHDTKILYQGKPNGFIKHHKADNLEQAFLSATMNEA